MHPVGQEQLVDLIGVWSKVRSMLSTVVWWAHQVWPGRDLLLAISVGIP